MRYASEQEWNCKEAIGDTIKWWWLASGRALKIAQTGTAHQQLEWDEIIE
jgi:hypothetical protein